MTVNAEKDDNRRKEEKEGSLHKSEREMKIKREKKIGLKLSRK